MYPLDMKDSNLTYLLILYDFLHVKTRTWGKLKSLRLYLYSLSLELPDLVKGGELYHKVV
jgi:hypothetical protein